MKKAIYKSLLIVYTISSSILFGGLFGFLIIYPFLQIIFDRLNISYGYDEPAWIHYLIYGTVLFSITITTLINKKRCEKQLRKRGY